uniref:AT-hook motif nuclear-localized protein n=1 Tax=Leersia perrieri TaxID=77586 RepID=A0A0D9VAC8_9ORYZ
MADDGSSSRADLFVPLQLPPPPPPPAPEKKNKPRGRPLGSKNKPKSPVFVTRESAAAMRPVVLQLDAGCDVAATVSAFARRRHVGVSVLCGRGAVAAVTLRLPSPPAAATAVTLHGRFEMLSLSGTVLPSAAAAPPSPAAFAVSLAGVGGQVIGGTLAGEMTVADGGMVVVAATFGCAEVHRLPADVAGEEEKVGERRHQQQTAVAVAAVDVGYGGGVGLGAGGIGEQVGRHQQQRRQGEMVVWAQTPASVGPAHPATTPY